MLSAGFAATIIPSMGNAISSQLMQEARLTGQSEGAVKWTPTPAPTLPAPQISAAEMSFLAAHEIKAGSTANNSILMTYDDILDDERLNHLLDVYREHGVKTSFFIIGIDLQNCSKSLPRILEEGHDIGCHGWVHDAPLTQLSDAAIAEQFGRFFYQMDLILPGYRVRYFRAPFGDRNQRVRDIGAAYGLQHVMWTLESGGLERSTYQNVINRVKPGDIVLSHAHRYYDVTDADSIVRELVRRGYNLQSVTSGMAEADRWSST